MGRAKEIKIKVIPSKIANEFIKEHHYSGKIVNNSVLHFGAFLGNVLHGVMSFGSPLDKRKVIGLVVDKNGEPCKWNEMLELNRMAFDEKLPRNSESRAISIAIKLLKKNAPHIKWILSFADGTQCGDGTIYRASGFKLTNIKENNQIWEIVGGNKTRNRTINRVSVSKGKNILKDGASSMKQFVDLGYKPLEGYQLRYIYIIDREYKLSVQEVPYSDIDKLGVGMYKGKKISIKERNASVVK